MELHEDVHVDESLHDDGAENWNEGAKAVGCEDDMNGISRNDDVDERKNVESAWKAAWTCGSVPCRGCDVLTRIVCQ